MTKERVCANSPAMSRRTLMAALPVAGVSMALPSIARPASGALVDVIRELEGWQGWEPSNVVATKAYAAYRMREAMGLDLPNPKYAQLHIDYQVWIFEDYKQSAWFERDVTAGKSMMPPRPSL
ncbi:MULTISPECIES: hypothetical protein [Roseobacteraceae]|uniref:Uncharacterized protein n=1 Tax=Pseudosulfitobacter pseudonitzschiae TaxID=1402135 RepID=A0A221K1H2_9RHOB|nr:MULTISPECIES: hypothetical protein [Roseobacteraceae]ASM72834.1 hypothetical protein SULPSESMR1_02031 [Pseudosulfitobacter pseudonitzschiae]